MHPENLFSMEDTPEQEPTEEETIILLKPGAEEYESRLMDWLKQRDLTAESRQETVLNEDTIRQFYPHAEEKHISGMVEHFANQPIVALLVRGPGAIDSCSHLKRHVRGILKLQAPADGIHTSDSAEEAAREKQVLEFEEKEK